MFRRNTGLLFALPALIVLGMLVAYPIAYTGVLSVTDQDIQPGEDANPVLTLRMRYDALMRSGR